ncbi:MAG: response regulator [Cryomorphaceae bacterium]|nr:MAG: response regulator [Cryomorphaceae bacterium]
MKRILLIDRTEADCALIERMFAENNDTVEIQHLSTMSAVHDFISQCLSTRVRHLDLPSLILLDINLPDAKEGLKILEQIQRSDKLKQIPVFVLSDNSDKDVIAACYVRGANGYFLKPTEKIQLSRAVKILSDRWQQLIQRGFGYHYKAV